MGAYVCPSCNTPLEYNENEITVLPNHKGVMGSCPNQETCGVELTNIVIDVNAENKP